jgi:hypothetical protein
MSAITHFALKISIFSLGRLNVALTKLFPRTLT